MSDALQGTDTQQSVVKVRPDREIATRQRLPYFVGLSAQSAGTRGLSMYLIVVPPGGHAEPHAHRGYETGIYVLEGSVETRYGPGLRESVVTEAGDFLFIPPGVPHQPFNLSDTTPAKAIVARTLADENEQVVPYDPADDA
ncbi:cupin domain-containing protein [Paraburkholderia sp. GAS42]|uniref:cupin domain-containing protein n=1 Tax=Paraburkholderia sp. GAS42 TaxID=3035135 RepID=UPI003D19A713